MPCVLPEDNGAQGVQLGVRTSRLYVNSDACGWIKARVNDLAGLGSKG